MPNIGSVLFGSGIIIGMQCITSYIIDAYSLYAASVLAATTVLRAIAGFGFPLFTPYMYQALQHGWGNSVLAFAAIAIGWPAPILLWKFGGELRAKSPYATGGSG
ncbi:MAG: hypothetical protein M1813_008548 [Trichoglossum hirsutum]|nr:MAG: hypothetical protein M1813_008548 [Trichoglossum hirsutum]